MQILEYGELIAIVPLPEDPVEVLHGMFEGGSPLTQDLLAEREQERMREEGANE